MNHPIYKQCENSLRDALEVLDRLRQRQTTTLETVRMIRLRRRTADIAMQATFEELRHTFITPIEREEMLRLRQITAAIACYAEDVLLSLYRHRQQAPLPDDTALLSATTQECQLLLNVLETLPNYPRSDTVVEKLTTLERQHRKSEELNSSPSTDTMLKKFSAACFSAAETIRYILLKIT